MKRYKFHILVALLLVILVATGITVTLRDALIDYRFSLTKRQATGQIALVEIDAHSITSFGVWPWPRSLHAQLIQQLEKAGVTDIAFDVDFSAASTASTDAALAEALKTAGGSVILAAFRQRLVARNGEQTLQVNRPLPAFSGSAWLGLVNVVPERDGVIRRYVYGDMIDGTFTPSMGALLAGKHELSASPFLIDFGIDPQSVPRVSYSDVIGGDAASLAAIAGKKVIISGTAVELGDRFNTPNSRIIPGSMVQVLGAESLLQGRALSVSSLFVAALGAALVLLVMLAMWERSRAVTRVICLVGLAVLIEGLAIVVQMAWPIALDTSLALVTIIAFAGAIGFAELDLRTLLSSIAERRFQNIAISLGDGVVCLDDQGRITIWNPAAAMMFGYEADEVAGKNFDILLSDMAGSSATPAFANLLEQARHTQGSAPVILELTGLRKSGDMFDLECSLSAWDATQGVQYGAVLRDISARKQQLLRIRYLAEYDTLTHLPNRNSLISRVDVAVRARDPKQASGALMLAGIKNFDHINNLCGHSLGDQLLVAVAGRLTRHLGTRGYVARLGNDEFALFLADADEHVLRECGQALLDGIHAEEIEIAGQKFRIVMAIGTALVSEATSAEELLGNAHFALSIARSSGTVAPVPYISRMREAIEWRSALERELRLAVTKGEFELFYQPQVELESGKVIGAEALIRWRHPVRGYVSPGEFLPVVNTTTLSEIVASWVLRTACQQAATWQNAGYPVRIGINMAQSQFTSGDLVADVADMLTQTGLTPDLLELEVTEDIILDRVEHTQRMLASLRELGVHTAYDDFGTGYGSLIYLKTFPLDKIKIDQSFVRGIRLAGDDAAIVTSTVMLAKALGLSVIAEGVEDQLTADLLLAIGCRQAQGYFFGKPMPAAEFEHRYLASSDKDVLSA